VSFCQVHLKTDVQAALKRNSEREVKVTDAVIVTMATKMEAPETDSNSWEKHSVCLESDNDNV